MPGQLKAGLRLDARDADHVGPLPLRGKRHALGALADAPVPVAEAADADVAVKANAPVVSAALAAPMPLICAQLLGYARAVHIRLHLRSRANIGTSAPQRIGRQGSAQAGISMIAKGFIPPRVKNYLRS